MNSENINNFNNEHKDLDVSMLEVFWQKKFFIIAFTLAAFVFAFVLAKTSRPMFQARASFFALEGAKYRGGGVDPFVSAAQVSNYITQTTEMNRSHSIATQLLLIVYSRSLAKMVIDEMPEIADYMWPNADKTHPLYKEMLAERLRSTVFVDLTNHTKPPVLVTTLGDPQLAVKLANTYLDVLRVFVDKNSINNETKNRTYLETQVGRYREELEKAEKALKEFEVSNRLVDIELQARGALNLIQNFRGDLIKKQIDLEVLTNSPTSSKEAIRKLQEEIDHLKQQIDFQAKGLVPEKLVADGIEYYQFIPGGILALPELASKHGHLKRDVENLRKIYSTLIERLELARLREQVEPTTFFVLDPAVAAPQVAPNVKVQSIYGGMLGLLLSCCFLVVKTLLMPVRKLT